MPMPRFVAEGLTEEYFDEVAWPAYKAYHSHHEPGDDGSRPATYKELLRWAMDQIFRVNGVVGHPYRNGQGDQQSQGREQTNELLEAGGILSGGID
ncbi:hypothetical protein CABS01_04558 [Colletotrichum abscissum]|uniref:uncharacterized protein n=1 Tax=Colletotrichum abscissum TaxID=1671311 RepID=UPI0027D4E205|nr:uncharacterized protein CABS01_04558 [Colletotrichum abscissum]KAK1471915.1 hypothetical protein CABS01_04558 [Colletotrichum abscissum]